MALKLGDGSMRRAWIWQYLARSGGGSFLWRADGPLGQVSLF